MATRSYAAGATINTSEWAVGDIIRYAHGANFGPASYTGSFKSGTTITYPSATTIIPYGSGTPAKVSGLTHYLRGGCTFDHADGAATGEANDGNGIEITNSPGSGIAFNDDDVTIRYTKVSGCGTNGTANDRGIYGVNAQRVLIEYCRVNNTKGGDNINLLHTTNNSVVTANVVRYNRLWDPGPQAGDNYQSSNPRNQIVEYNRFGGSISGKGHITQTTHSTIAGTVPVVSSIYRGNHFSGPANWCIGAPCSNLTIVDNVFDGDGPSADYAALYFALRHTRISGAMGDSSQERCDVDLSAINISNNVFSGWPYAIHIANYSVCQQSKITMSVTKNTFVSGVGAWMWNAWDNPTTRLFGTVSGNIFDQNVGNFAGPQGSIQIGNNWTTSFGTNMGDPLVNETTGVAGNPSASAYGVQVIASEHNEGALAMSLNTTTVMTGEASGAEAQRKLPIDFIPTKVNAAGTASVSDWISVDDAYEVTVNMKTRNGAVAPTTGTLNIIETSPDGGLHNYEFHRWRSPIGISAEATQTYTFPGSVRYIRTQHINNQGASVTVESLGSKLVR